MELTVEQYKVLKELQSELGGKCGSVCPSFIFEHDARFSTVWSCSDCVKMFSGFKPLPFDDCPCDAFGQLAVQRLDEVISEYEGRKESGNARI